MPAQRCQGVADNLLYLTLFCPHSKQHKQICEISIHMTDSYFVAFAVRKCKKDMQDGVQFLHLHSRVCLVAPASVVLVQSGALYLVTFFSYRATLIVHFKRHFVS